ncbi:MAG: helix-turn-helix transcriptional regulator [Bacilli bacterium]|nr:helix-turn-helix transcriptional regulator [Bacilli bacterium]
MIGDKIKCYRKKNKMTQEQLAEKLDITRQTLSK